MPSLKFLLVARAAHASSSSVEYTSASEGRQHAGPSLDDAARQDDGGGGGGGRGAWLGGCGGGDGGDGGGGGGGGGLGWMNPAGAALQVLLPPGVSSLSANSGGYPESHWQLHRQ